TKWKLSRKASKFAKAQPTDSTIFLRQTCLSDQSIRSAPDQTTTRDHQIRPPHQTTRSDHPTRPQTTILDYSASNHHSIPNLLKWYRSDGPCWTKPDNDDNDDDDDDGDVHDDDHDDRLH
ncbi:unnamed protein product, partial [Porites lobata]